MDLDENHQIYFICFSPGTNGVRAKENEIVVIIIVVRLFLCLFWFNVGFRKMRRICGN